MANVTLRDWISIDDRVMGGVSQSEMTQTDESLVFSGNVCLDNNGGFASVRTLLNLSGLDSNAKVKLRFKGDGKRYQLRFRTDKYVDGVAYAVHFDTIEDTVQEIVFSLDQFVPVWRGRRVPNAQALSWDDVNQLGLMISDKQVGDFRLEISSIEWLSSS